MTSRHVGFKHHLIYEPFDGLMDRLAFVGGIDVQSGNGFAYG
jgi:hypothetical protein